MTHRDPRAPLLEGVSQFDVDFVIPRVGIDLPVGIDPFLLFKSRDAVFRGMHQEILDAFNSGIAAIRGRHIDSARALYDFPEVAEIGFGYTGSGKRGSGVGTYLAGLIIETVANAPELQERGVLHVEEMQLLSAGIGADRISDIAANILKGHLIEYTQRQCTLWDIPVKSGVPLPHVYNAPAETWDDGYFDLPVNPIDGSAILFVPRRIVRALPWINYDDFIRTEFKAYLAARRKVIRQKGTSKSTDPLPATVKADVVALTRSDISLVERYVRARERASEDAKPTFEYLDGDARRQAEELKARLKTMSTGRPDAASYQLLVLEVLNFLFNPELIDGRLEVATIDGTERRDIIFTNDSDESFWDYVRNEHSALLFMFEVKNVDALDTAALNQTATYLGDRLGTFAAIVTRNQPSEAMYRKAYSIWNDSAPKRKVILFITDQDLCELLDLRSRDASPTRWIQQRYRRFRETVQ